ncbi:MAG: hypothetical protein ABIP94_10890 [Planctomycetota bacterium]
MANVHQYFPVSPFAFCTAALLSVSGVGAFAAEPAAQPLTQAQVRAEYLRARAAGEIASPADFYAPVRAALHEAQRARHVEASAEVPRIVALPSTAKAASAR